MLFRVRLEKMRMRMRMRILLVSSGAAYDGYTSCNIYPVGKGRRVYRRNVRFKIRGP